MSMKRRRHPSTPSDDCSSDHPATHDANSHAYPSFLRRRRISSQREMVTVSNHHHHKSSSTCSSNHACIKIISATYGPCEESFGQTTSSAAAVAAKTTSTIPSQLLTTKSSFQPPGCRNCLASVRALLFLSVMKEQRQEENEREEFNRSIITATSGRQSAKITENDVLSSSSSSSFFSSILVPLTVQGSSKTFVSLFSGVGGTGCSMNAMFGDPCPGTSKQLQISYTVNEGGTTEIFHSTFSEHEQVLIRRRRIQASSIHDRLPHGRQSMSDESPDCDESLHQSFSWDATVSEIVLPHVLSYLDIYQRMKCRQVCRTWKSVIAESGVASTIDYTDRRTVPIFSRHFLRGILRYSYQSLQRLVLTGFRDIEKDDLHHSIPHLHRLRSLDLTRCVNLDDSTMELLSKHVYATLQVLYLKGLRKITDNGVVMICQSCSALEVLDISHISLLTDDGGGEIRHLTKLRALFLRDNYLLTNQSFDIITKSCSRLSQLTLWGCIKMNRIHFDTTSASHGEGLVILNLCGCYSLQDDSAEAIGHMHQLRSLIVNECHRLTNKFFESLVAQNSNLPRVQHLHMRYLRLLTDKGLKAIAQHMVELASLDLSFCTQISHDGLYELLELRHETLAELSLKSCRNLEITIPRRGPDGQFESNSHNNFNSPPRRFKPNRFDGLGSDSPTRIRRNLATNAGHWMLNSLRPRGKDHALRVLDVRSCEGKKIDYVYTEEDDFLSGMMALDFEQQVPGFFVRALGPGRCRRAMKSICQFLDQ